MKCHSKDHWPAVQLINVTVGSTESPEAWGRKLRILGASYCYNAGGIGDPSISLRLLRN